MKNRLYKRILAVLGYLWGSVLFSLVASFGVTLMYRLFEGGMGNLEHLVTGGSMLMVQLTCVMACFYRYGYYRESLEKKELLLALGLGGGLHFLICIPFHFSLYTGGTAALKLTEYVYRICNPSLPAQIPFTDIPMGLCMLGFLAVELLALALAYVATRRGQAKRKRDREELTGRPA